MGALGRVHPNGDLDLALTIRTFAVAEDRIHLWVGGGIVWDSDPQAEIEESLVKARPLLELVGAPLPGARCGERDPAGGRRRGPWRRRPADEPVCSADDEALLRGRAAFETLRVYGGRPFRFDGHVARMQASAARLGVGLARRLRRGRGGGARGGGRAGSGAAPVPDPGAGGIRPAGRDGARQRADGRSRRAPREGDQARVAARSTRGGAVAARGRQVDELRGEHGGRGGGEGAGRRRRRVRPRRRRPARGHGDERLVAARLDALHAVARTRHPRRRHARGAARARPGGGLRGRAGRVPARRPARRRRGVYQLICTRGDAGGRRRRSTARPRPGLRRAAASSTKEAAR